ncbi:poly [ADP-ribose] polymerase tankyrase-2-like isoform X3 [Branchiostoma floridae]|uniref:Poly [ADP-ribose] polymerase tankyrase-2-like isoform X3 n=1 Tax=Branchiostoma floridae TaxID=7739 RepID=A0A9J7KLD1_BRAFL|nr:poly [ADP-ribose] polymerase tankyrase-2-like isoform X3 [Branchiostoma floridae]
MAETFSDANGSLLYAAENGSVEGVKMALKAGAHIDFDHVYSQSVSSGTALYNASMLGHVDVVKLLLRKGASVAKRIKSSFTPLHAAAYEGLTEVVDLLVQHGATVDVRDGFQNTPLMAACGHNYVDTVRRLLELGARPYLTHGYLDERALESSRPSLKLIEEVKKTKLLRCCNPKCGKPGYRKTLKLCGRCKLTRYCSRDCQIQHWSVGHKKCCGHDVYSDDPAFKLYKSMAETMMACAHAK